MKKALVAFALFPIMLIAQNNMVDKLKAKESNSGVINIYQDARITNLIGQFPVDGESSNRKISGYRIQVYAGNNSRESKSEAASNGAQVKSLFPDLKVYTYFLSPRWICRVGDYTTYEEAYQIMREIKKNSNFRELSIVKEQIMAPY